MMLSSAYRRAFEQDCIELIVNAYNVAITEKKYQADWRENDFSELLGYYVNASQLSLDKGITCKTENKILSETDNQEKGYADKLSRIDFVYFKIWNNKRYYYYMEAKNLKENNRALKKRYINTGIDNLVKNIYQYGALVGYLLEGCVNPTIDGINELLTDIGRANERLYPKDHDIVKHYYESDHSKFILKHLIFDFTEIS